MSTSSDNVETVTMGATVTAVVFIVVAFICFLVVFCNNHSLDQHQRNLNFCGHTSDPNECIFKMEHTS